jgi:hypothetical protein
MKDPPKTFDRFVAGSTKPKRQTPEQIKLAFARMMGIPQEQPHVE